MPSGGVGCFGGPVFLARGSRAIHLTKHRGSTCSWREIDTGFSIPPQFDVWSGAANDGGEISGYNGIGKGGTGSPDGLDTTTPPQDDQQRKPPRCVMVMGIFHRQGRQGMGALERDDPSVG